METKTANTSPRVYVGTWKKYNEGSLKGRWIDLADFSEYDDFLRYCGVVHSDERDPEFMVQDCENFPDGLSVTEWLSREDFQDVKEAMNAQVEEQVRLEVGAPSWEIVDYSEKALAVIGDTRPISGQLKTLGGRFNARLSCGAGWIFSKRKEAELRALLQGAEVTPATSAPRVDDKKFRDEFVRYVEQMNETPYWKDYYLKQKSYAVKLSDGWVIIDSPRIENKFCFHDEGPDYEFYKTLMADEGKLRNYFLSENLDGLDKEIERLKDETEPLYTRPMSQNQVEVLPGRAIFGYYDYIHGKKEPRQITQEERAELLTAYGLVREAFEKRLQTYLKKYGVSKLHTWTYWADA